MGYFIVQCMFFFSKGVESGSRCLYWKELQSRDHKRQQRNGSLLFCILTQGSGWYRSASFVSPLITFLGGNHRVCIQHFTGRMRGDVNVS